jgi:hypothetical protein
VRAAVAAGTAGLLALLGVGCPEGRPAGPGRSEATLRAGNQLNVLLITIDTLRPDHMGVYGYGRDTTPRIDALARRGAVFDEAYTYWPKTRGSFVAIMTGRLAAQSGYGKSHPLLLDFNPTLASVLKQAGYDTVATVDNPNVAASLGYAKGFDRYRETWEEQALATETDRARAITEDGVRFLEAARPDRPFLLWLHYVNPHAPYTPPPPFDTAFLDDEGPAGPPLPSVNSFFGGVHRPWEVPGQPLGYYVAQYDGEIAANDVEVGRARLLLRPRGQPLRPRHADPARDGRARARGRAPERGARDDPRSGSDDPGRGEGLLSPRAPREEPAAGGQRGARPRPGAAVRTERPEPPGLVGRALQDRRDPHRGRPSALCSVRPGGRSR